MPIGNKRMGKEHLGQTTEFTPLIRKPNYKLPQERKVPPKVLLYETPDFHRRYFIRFKCRHGDWYNDPRTTCAAVKRDTGKQCGCRLGAITNSGYVKV